MSTIRTLCGGLKRKYVILTCLSPFSMVGEVLLETLIPLIMVKIIDVGIKNHDIYYVVRTGALMIALSFLSLCFGAAGGRLASVASQGFSANLRRKLFAKVQTYSFLNIDRFGTGSLVTRLTTDVTNLQNMYQALIRPFVRSPFMLVSGTIMASYLNLRLATVFFTAIPVLGLFLFLIARTAYPRFKTMFLRYDELNNTVQENLRAIRVVKSFVRGEFENQKFSRVAELLRDTQAGAERIVVLNAPLMMIVTYSCIISVLWFGGNMIIAGTMTTGELVSFVTYISQILMSLMMLSMMFIQLIMSRTSCERVLEVLHEEIDIKNPAEPVTEVKDGSIDFNDVSFSYFKDKTKCALEHISLHIPSGLRVGIIGGTGSSKTTLVSMIERLYDVTEGSVCVGGVDVRKYDTTVLRDSVAMVLQKNVLFSGTIAENLRWGNERATDDELRSVCKAAQADDFICSFPAGYDTELGQGGVNLSGGQKQRLCIARALLKHPRILILDDSTSACDTATDAKIRSALSTTCRGITQLIIAQRISSVQDCDLIVVLDEGRVAATGKHTELLQTSHIYREVYDTQQTK